MFFTVYLYNFVGTLPHVPLDFPVRILSYKIAAGVQTEVRITTVGATVVTMKARLATFRITYAALVETLFVAERHLLCASFSIAKTGFFPQTQTCSASVRSWSML